ncbi:MAG: hypothetical protein SH809_05165 [Rhodothermales bacterium]|nr:hypothetical protein [Rhodothermales bacterium]
MKHPMPPNEGSALALVLMVFTILTALFGTVLMVQVAQSRFVRRDVFRLQARYAAEGCLARALVAWAEAPGESEDTEPDCRRTSRLVGGFVRVQLEARAGPARHRIDALVGFELPESLRDAILHADAHGQLHLAGRTIVRGSIRAGSQGVRTGVLDGRPFSGEVDGPIHRVAVPALPAFDSRGVIAQRDRLRAWVAGDSPPEDGPDGPTRVRGETLQFGTVDSALFRSPVLLLSRDNLLLAGSLHLKSGSILVAGGALEISGDVRGEGVLAYAGRTIEVTGRVELAAQLVAEEGIRVAEHTRLNYPSVLLVIGQAGDLEEAGEDVPGAEIRLTGAAVVDGSVIAPKIDGEAGGRVIVEAGATVRGLVYSAGQSEIAGQVLGTVATHRFHFYASPTHYVNWLRDTRIDLHARPAPFHLPLGFEGATTPEVVTIRSWGN